MPSTTSQLYDHLETRGFHGRALPAHHVDDLEKELEAWRRQQALDEAFDQQTLRGFCFAPPEDLEAARSLIVVANPQPQIQLLFHWEGREVPLILPPTYAWRRLRQETEDLLLEVLGPLGYSLAQAALPVKLLAVHAGLARYGTNNLCYVPTLGTFHGLSAFYSDLPCEDDPWQELAPLERCQGCSACRRHCPTGAIAEDRFLLHAERCLTYHNERVEDPPAWLDPAWHHCLVGCMRCQLACPENSAVRGWIEPGPEFSPEETALLVDGVPAEELPAATAAKLASLDLLESLDLFPRNLGLLLRAGASHG